MRGNVAMALGFDFRLYTTDVQVADVAWRSTGSELDATNREGYSISSSRCPSDGRSDESEAFDHLGLASWIGLASCLISFGTTGIR